jgi:hypothetical protein
MATADELSTGASLAWRSVTTDDLAGIDIPREAARHGCGFCGEVDQRAPDRARSVSDRASLHPNTKPIYANSAAKGIKGRLNSGC